MLQQHLRLRENEYTSLLSSANVLLKLLIFPSCCSFSSALTFRDRIALCQMYEASFVAEDAL